MATNHQHPTVTHQSNIMSSFAKACVDLSNNLRNFRFSKPSSPVQVRRNAPDSVETITAPPPPPSTPVFHPHNRDHLCTNNNTTSTSHSHNITSSSPPFYSSQTLPLPNFNHSVNATSLSRVCSPNLSNSSSRGATVAAIKQRLFNQGLRIDLSPRRRQRKTRYKEYMLEHFRTKVIFPHLLLENEAFLIRLFMYFSISELCQLSCVSSRWFSVLCAIQYRGLLQVSVDYRQPPWREKTSSTVLHTFNYSRSPYTGMMEEVIGLAHYTTLLSCMTRRGIHTLCLKNFHDEHVTNLLLAFHSHTHVVHSLIIRYSNIGDRSLMRMTESLTTLESLELHCCNDFTEVCFWSALLPNIKKLTVSDCINMSDESMGAVCQLLPYLCELNLQAYHVTDLALSYVAEKSLHSIQVLRLVQCMEITNQGLIHVAKGLPHLKVLSLYGCSKVTDDGLDVVCEHMRQLTSLDLSWCNKITDSGLECVACDLQLLQELALDRCIAVTDLGIGYLATLPELKRLYLRWCLSLTDASIIHILNMTNLLTVSLAGCRRITGDGLCGLVRHGRLRFIELTNCFQATPQVVSFIEQNRSHCVVIK